MTFKNIYKSIGGYAWFGSTFIEFELLNFYEPNTFCFTQLNLNRFGDTNFFFLDWISLGPLTSWAGLNLTLP